MLVVAIVVFFAVVAIWVYVIAPSPLTIEDVSMKAVIQGDFVNYSSLSPLVQFFNATTTVDQTGYPTSVLSLRMTVSAFGPFTGFPATYGIFIRLGVVGRIAPNLHPGELVLTYNQTGYELHALGSEELTGANPLPPVNVTTCPPPGCTLPSVEVADNGSGALTSPLYNDNGAAAYYYFSYPAFFEIRERVGLDFFVGVRITLAGPFTPSVSVGILVQVMDVPA